MIRIQNPDLREYARSFHKAAKALMASFQASHDGKCASAACPAIFLYRHALELHLKAIVLGKGGNLLATEPDPISVGKTHSVSWLAQSVCQMVTKLKWEEKFNCQTIGSLADFKSFVHSTTAVDPGAFIVDWPVDPRVEADLQNFTATMDALLELLDSTGDALTAEWFLRSAEPLKHFGNDWGPLIQ